MDSVSYADYAYSDVSPVYTINYANQTACCSTSYTTSSISYVEEIPMKLINLGYHEDKEDFEFPWRREDISLRVSMRASGVDVIVKRDGKTSSKNEDKTASFYVSYQADMSEFRRLLLESEIKVSS